MIKASAGGGGKGMRVAWNEEETRYPVCLSVCLSIRCVSLPVCISVSLSGLSIKLPSVFVCLLDLSVSGYLSLQMFVCVCD